MSTRVANTDLHDISELADVDEGRSGSPLEHHLHWIIGFDIVVFVVEENKYIIKYGAQTWKKCQRSMFLVLRMQHPDNILR